MRFFAAKVIILLLVSCEGLFAYLPEKLSHIRGEGCVEPGVETRCFILLDVRNGAQFSLFFKGVQPEIGSGIEFIGLPHHGVSTCTQGVGVDVQSWAHRDLKCTQGTAPKPKK